MTKNFPSECEFLCVADKQIVTKGGHIPIRSTCQIPHLDIVTEAHIDKDENDPDPYIDFDKITSGQDLDYQNAACSALQTLYDAYLLSTEQNPVQFMNQIFEKLKSMAFEMLPCRPSGRTRRNPGWNKYVKKSQQEYEIAEALWDLSGRSPHGPLAQNLTRAKAYGRLCIRKMKRNIQKSIAEQMADDFSAATEKHDKLRAWQPVRAAIKGSASACSPIIEGHRSTESIAYFWKDYYKSKLNGTDGALPEPSSFSLKLREMASESDTKLKITPSQVLNSLETMNLDCSYYDKCGPKLFRVGSKNGYQLPLRFSEIFANLLESFINMPLDTQIELLSSGSNFRFRETF